MMKGTKPDQIATPSLEIDKILNDFFYSRPLQDFINTLSADHVVTKLGVWSISDKLQIILLWKQFKDIIFVLQLSLKDR